jgi:hypothetical protein
VGQKNSPPPLKKLNNIGLEQSIRYNLKGVLGSNRCTTTMFF